MTEWLTTNTLEEHIKSCLNIFAISFKNVESYILSWREFWEKSESGIWILLEIIDSCPRKQNDSKQELNCPFACIPSLPTS